MEEDEYIGEIRLFAADFAPEGWVLCDGTAYPVSGHEALFALIGTTWGQQAPNMFCVPDLRDRVPIGQGQGQEQEQGKPMRTRTLGTYGGLPSVLADLPPHYHRLRVSKASATENTVAGKLPGTVIETGTVGGLYLKVPGTGVAFSEKAIESKGESVPHDNHMPSFAINYIICVRGVFPDLN